MKTTKWKGEVFELGIVRVGYAYGIGGGGL